MDFFEEAFAEDRYPELVIDRTKLRGNIEEVVKRCGDRGIGVAGVIKGMNGLTQIAEVYDASGVTMIGSSRIEQLRDAKEAGVEKPLMMIRTPMISEAYEVAEICDYSLNSENATLRALDEAANSMGKLHKVILMMEMGDLREGYATEEELIDACLMVENELTGVHLAGIGMNVGCYGSILPSRDKLDRFCEIAEDVEKAIWRKLEIVSGGATSSFVRLLEDDIPEKINQLRIGEAILVARDTSTDCYIPDKYDVNLNRGIMTLTAEVVEVKEKPTHPIGKIGHDAFGHTPEYEDRGVRKRAIVALGKLDYGSEDDIIPVEPGIEILGASSDHTILDVEELVRPLEPGDTVAFRVNYASMLYLTDSRNVSIKYKD